MKGLHLGIHETSSYIFQSFASGHVNILEVSRFTTLRGIYLVIGAGQNNIAHWLSETRTQTSEGRSQKLLLSKLVDIDFYSSHPLVA